MMKPEMPDGFSVLVMPITWHRYCVKLCLNLLAVLKKHAKAESESSRTVNGDSLSRPYWIERNARHHTLI